jgi:ATP phosphoribosyltransferase
MFVRAQDIPEFIAKGALDFGITGLDQLAESGYELTNLLNLEFGYCHLAVAVPEESPVRSIDDIPEGSRIATSFPNVTRRFFESKGKDVSVIVVSGAATEQVYGTWTYTVDLLADVTERKNLLDPALLAHLELTDFSFPVVLTLLPDGTYTFGADPTGYAAAVDSLHSQLAAATDIMLEGMLEQDQIDMGVTEFLDYTNLTYDKLLEQSYALLLPVNIADALAQSGSFTWTGDSLQLGEKVANAATLQEGVLTLTAAEGETLPYAQYLFPMTLTRAD